MKPIAMTARQAKRLTQNVTGGESETATKQDREALMIHYLWMREKMAGGRLDPRELNTDEWIENRKQFVKLMLPIYVRQKGTK